MAIESNDDRILHCCLLYQTKTRGLHSLTLTNTRSQHTHTHTCAGHDGIVVLFSNDLNLCAKAMGNGVKAADRTVGSRYLVPVSSYCLVCSSHRHSSRSLEVSAKLHPEPHPLQLPRLHLLNLNQPLLNVQLACKLCTLCCTQERLGAPPYRRGCTVTAVFCLLGEGKKASGIIAPQHSTEQAMQPTNMSIQTSQDYEYTGTQICHRSLL